MFIWRADGNNPGTGGTIAHGVILSRPALKIAEDKNYWVQNIPPKKRLMVDIRILECCLSSEEGMIMRTYLKQHPRLHTLHILKFRQWTNYHVHPHHASLLIDLWKYGM